MSKSRRIIRARARSRPARPAIRAACRIALSARLRSGRRA